MIGLWLIACTGGTGSDITGDSASEARDSAGESDSGDSGADTDTSGPCSRGMAAVDDAFCMDRYEAALEEWTDEGWQAASPYETVSGRTVRAVVQKGLIPQGYLSGDEAAEACVAAGKRLCSDSEWNLACVGPDDTTWPYGDSHVEGACNDDYEGIHPVVDYFGTTDGVWASTSMNDAGINQQPGTVAPGGEYAACRSHWGIQDLHGNLHEWVDESSGVFRGGFYGDASFNGNGCTYVTTTHTRTYHDYSTGFRCCSEL